MRSILKLQKSLTHVAVALTVYSFGSALVGVFIPLIILHNGGRLWEVPAFYLLYAACKLCINYPSVLLIQKRGAHFGLGAGFMAGAVQILSIFGFSLAHAGWLLVTGAASLSFTDAFLWNSQHLYISRAMSESSKSSSIATISIIWKIGSVVAPLVGGLIGAYLGTDFLLGLAVVVCLLAIVPLLGMGRLSGADDSIRISYNLTGAPAKDILANFSYNIETAVSVLVWPIYLAVFIANYKGIGVITTLAAVVAIIVTWIAGHRGDKGQDRAVLREGVTVTSIVDIARVLVSTQAWIVAISSAYAASLAYFQNAWTSIYYHHAKQRGLQYIMSMEIANDLAYVMLWGTLLIVLLASSSRRAFFVAAFIIAAIAAWGCLLIRRQNSGKQS